MIKENEELAVRPEVETFYKGFKDYGYTYASALSEFIDNSIASFRDNEKLLSEYKKQNKKFEKSIAIIFDRTNNQLIIRDTAFGILSDDFQRSLKVGQKKTKQGGLNEFGKGMKSAGFWFGRNIEVLTNAYFEKKSSPFSDGATYGLYWKDIEKGSAVIKPRSNSAKMSKWRLQHGTVVKVIDLYKDRMPQNTVIKSIIDKIAHNYRIDIVNNDLEIYFYSIEKTSTGAKIYDLNEWKNNGGNKKEAVLKSGNLLDGRVLTFTPVEERFLEDGTIAEVKFDFKIKYQGETLPVSGRLFQKAKGSRNKNVGIDLVRRGRIIEENFEGMYVDKSGFLYQRVSGEMILDKFPVTQTKDKILWEGELFEKVKNELRSLPEVKKFEEMVKEYRAITKVDPIDLTEDIAPTVKDFSNGKGDLKVTAVKHEDVKKDIVLQKEDKVFKVKTQELDNTITVISRIDYKGVQKDWLDIRTENGYMIATTNINHIFFNPFNDLKENGRFGADFIKMLRIFSIYWAVAEEQSVNSGKNATQFRELFSSLIERN